MSEKFIEIYPLPQYLDDDSFGWAGPFKQERMLIKTSDVLKAWIHIGGEESNYVEIEYFDHAINSKYRAMFGVRTVNMERLNWSYALASKDFETLSLELNKND